MPGIDHQAGPRQRREVGRRHTGDLGCRLGGEAAVEDSEAREPTGQLVGQQRHAPRDRVPQRALAGAAVPRAVGREVERLPVRELLLEQLERDLVGPRRDQLDRQRDPVELLAELGHGVGGASNRRSTLRARSTKSGTASAGASGSSGTTRSPYSRSRIRLVTSTRSPGAAGQQLGHHRRRVLDLLEVVEDQQQAEVAQVRLQRREYVAGGDLDLEHVGDRPGHQPVVVQRVQGDEPHAVGMIGGEAVGDREAEPGLADAAGPGDREQPAAPGPAAGR